MDRLVLLLGLIALLAVLLYKTILYPAWISPLSNLPTPHPLCRTTSRWMTHQSTNSRELKTLYTAHQELGPIVRLGPNEVSVVSQESLKKVYVAGLDKDVWYQNKFMCYGHQNLVCTLDHKKHAVQKRMISKLYTKSYLQGSGNMAILSRHVISERLLPLVQRSAATAADVNVVELFEWASDDLITAYLFGLNRGTDFLRNKESRDRYFRAWSKKKGASCVYAEELCMGMCKAVLAKQEDRERSSDPEPVVFSVLYRQMCKAVESGSMQVKDGDVLSRCASEMLDHIIATQETNTITLTYIFHRLSQHPELQTRLRSELLSLRPSMQRNNDPQSVPSAAAIDSLPLLNAVIYETLRLHAANPARLPRVVPVHGSELHGYYIPAGTVVSTNAYCLHRNAEVFSRPLEWMPGRWLDETSRREGLRWFWAFGSGPRMCIGNNFAMQVIKLIVAAICSQYTMSIIDDTGIEQTDSYNSGPASHRLMLRFSPVE